MKGQSSQTLVGNAIPRKLRKNMTDAETRIWQRLRGRQLAGHRFRRQHPFLDYVLDFVCLERRLVVEIDGGQHLENLRDQIRDRCLREAGFTVLRFWNNQALQETDAVAEVILRALQKAAPHPLPNPPLEGEGDNPLPLEGEGVSARLTLA